MKNLSFCDFILTTTCIFLTSATLVYAQAPHSEGGDSLTQDQLDYCAKYHIDPCTNNNILAKERVDIGGPGTHGIPANQPLQPTDWLMVGIGTGATSALVAVGIFVIKMKREARTNRMT